LQSRSARKPCRCGGRGAAFVCARERHGALELLWSLKLDVEADVVWQAASEQ
jgi:hypothetical protein